MSEDTIHPRILCLPTEVLLTVASYLDFANILVLRQTCSTLSDITKERCVWARLFHQLQEKLPFPPDIGPAVNLVHVTTSALEELVSSTCRNACLWPRLRQEDPHKIKPKLGDSLLGLQMFLDRWLLIIYSDGIIHLRDIIREFHADGSSVDTPVTGSTLNLGSSRWTSYTACLNPLDKTKVILAITRALPPCRTRIYEVNLEEWSSPFTGESQNQPSRFQLLRSIYRPSPETVRALDPVHNLVAFSNSNSIALVNWVEANDDFNTLSVFNTSHEIEDLWNGTIAVRFLDPYMLIFKTRTIELYHYMSRLHPEVPRLPSLKHSFAMTFRDVSFSDSKTTIGSNDASMVISLNILAFDVVMGLFYFKVSITIPNTRLGSTESYIPPPILDVTLIRAHSMADHMEGTLSHEFMSSPSQVVAPDMTPTPTPTSYGNRTGFNPSARGFICTHCLGPQGKRAVWVERVRGSTVREVQVWGHNPKAATNDAEDDLPIKMDGYVVHQVRSYDLREDTTHCTLSESRGQIVLGNRRGDVFILKLGDIL